MSAETIIVTKNVQGKFGPQLLVGKEYYSFGKFYKGETALELGVPIVVDVFTTEAGKKYINKVTGASAPALVAPVFKDTPVVKAKAVKPVVTDNSMSKDEWAAKDTRISRQGVIQVAVQVAGSFEDAVVLADRMLNYVNQVK